jgi:hypothetical protein
MELKRLDVLTLQDTRLTATESSTMSSIIRKKHLTNIQVRCAPIPAEQNSPRTDRVGGQMVIIIGKWANKVINFAKDPSNHGVVSGLFLRTAPDTHILIISSYWPFPTNNREDNKLWNKVLRYTQAHSNAISPLVHCQQYINELLVRHYNPTLQTRRF